MVRSTKPVSGQFPRTIGALNDGRPFRPEFTGDVRGKFPFVFFARSFDPRGKKRAPPGRSRPGLSFSFSPYWMKREIPWFQCSVAGKRINSPDRSDDGIVDHVPGGECAPGNKSLRLTVHFAGELDKHWPRLFGPQSAEMQTATLPPPIAGAQPTDRNAAGKALTNIRLDQLFSLAIEGLSQTSSVRVTLTHSIEIAKENKVEPDRSAGPQPFSNQSLAPAIGWRQCAVAFPQTEGRKPWPMLSSSCKWT